jgi:hypothetical protein
LHPNIVKEARRMAIAKGKRDEGLDLLCRYVEQVGLETFIKQIGVDYMIEAADPKKVVKALGVERLAANLTAEEWKQLKKLRD